MSQSFWVTPEYQKFIRYTEKLEKTHREMDDMELKKHIKNWHSGVEKMQQLAIGYDVEYTPPDPTFLTYSKKDKIHWVKLNKLDGFTVGLWDGPNAVIDGKPVFDPAYLDFARAGVKKLTEMDFGEAQMTFLEIMKDFDGVALPNISEPF